MKKGASLPPSHVFLIGLLVRDLDAVVEFHSGDLGIGPNCGQPLCDFAPFAVHVNEGNQLHIVENLKQIFFADLEVGIGVVANVHTFNLLRAPTVKAQAPVVETGIDETAHTVCCAFDLQGKAGPVMIPLDV